MLELIILEKFAIHFEEAAWEDLRHRLAHVRWPAGKSVDWRLGMDEEALVELLAFWRDSYDWNRREQALNQYPQFTCELDDVTIHFFHIPAKKPGAGAVLLTHGWPDSFLRYEKLFSLLPDYDLVVPSLPGFAFSSLPKKGYSSNAETAGLWHRLLTQVLAYDAYAAVGGDMGRGVSCYLAACYPQEVRGLYLTDVGFAGDLAAAPDEQLTPEELEYKQRANRWMKEESAYITIQSTKPQTLAYSLSDSPAGMAAWILEKYRAWSDWPLLTRNDLCDCLTLYWMTNTAGTSIRAYHGNSFHLPPMGPITVPTAIAAFPYDVLPVPKSWAERHYPVVQYTQMARGGHFTALEQPQEFAADLTKFLKRIF